MAKHLVIFAVFLLIATHFCDGSEGKEESSATVVRGSVFCDTCSDHSLNLPTTYFIPGAAVAVECSLNRKARASIRVEGRTDESGEFSIELPSSIYNTFSGCSVELINSPDGSCNVPSVGKLAFTMGGQRENVYCAGLLSYRPQIVPSVCFFEEEDSQKLISNVRGRAALEKDESSKQTTLPPPSLPNLIPPLPPVNIPNAPPLGIPNLSVPPLPTIPSLPNINAPPLPSIPTLPNMNAPPLPSLPTLPNFGIPPLPNIPFAPPISLNIPPLPFNIPPLPFNIPPLPFFTPPPPSK